MLLEPLPNAVQPPGARTHWKKFAVTPLAIARQRDCHFAGTPSSCLLKRLLEGEGGAAEYDGLADDGATGGTVSRRATRSRSAVSTTSASRHRAYSRETGGAAERQFCRRVPGVRHRAHLERSSCGAREDLWQAVEVIRPEPRGRPYVIPVLSFCRHPLSVPIETRTEVRGGCSRTTVPAVALVAP